VTALGGTAEHPLGHDAAAGIADANEQHVHPIETVVVLILRPIL
jgi:hypothetical protein